MSAHLSNHRVRALLPECTEYRLNVGGLTSAARALVSHNLKIATLLKMVYNVSMSFTLLCFFVSLGTLWTTPEPGVIQTELAPLLADGVVLSERSPSGAARFEEVIGILRHSSVQVERYLNQCDALAWEKLPFAQPVTLPQTPLDIYVGDGQTNYLFGALRYYLARRLVQARLFDEAKKTLDELTPENSIDPAGVLIHKAVVFHHFSERDEGLAVLKEFQAIAEQEAVPRRFAELARLLHFEWERQAKEEETEKISRQMSNVRRRLGQGRTDDDTQGAEEGVLKDLEKLIERIEEQAQKQRQQGQQGAQRPDRPPDDAYRAELRAPGNADRRDFSPGGNWGNLPPKEREDALLKIEREFPPHYRNIIEQYFREMAK